MSHARLRIFCPKIATFSQFLVYLNITQAKQIINLLLLNHFYPVMSYRRVQKESDEFIVYGRSLWSAISCQRKRLKEDIFLNFYYRCFINLFQHKWNSVHIYIDCRIDEVDVFYNACWGNVLETSVLSKKSYPMYFHLQKNCLRRVHRKQCAGGRKFLTFTFPRSRADSAHPEDLP